MVQFPENLLGSFEYDKDPCFTVDTSIQVTLGVLCIAVHQAPTPASTGSPVREH
jgi:hypothetical protein